MKVILSKFRRSPSVLVVATITVLVYWSLILYLGYRYYHLSGDWLKQSAEFLLLSIQSIGIVVGGYWVMRTFGWEKRVFDIQKVLDSLNELKIALPRLISELKIKGDENAYLTGVFELTTRLRHRALISQLPPDLKDSIDEAMLEVISLAARKNETDLINQTLVKSDVLQKLIERTREYLN